jgi:hypothetical protein
MLEACRAMTQESGRYRVESPRAVDTRLDGKCFEPEGVREVPRMTYPAAPAAREVSRLPASVVVPFSFAFLLHLDRFPPTRTARARVYLGGQPWPYLCPKLELQRRLSVRRNSRLCFGKRRTSTRLARCCLSSIDLRPTKVRRRDEASRFGETPVLLNSEAK